MQANIDDVRRELGVCMQYDVLFDHLTTKEHLLLYGQIKAPHWSPGELHEQVRRYEINHFIGLYLAAQMLLFSCTRVACSCIDLWERLGLICSEA